MPLTKNLEKYLLHLADNALILGQRLAEWCGHGPVLEQDIALSNIALDLVGRGRLLYQHISELSDNEKSEDDFAFLRREHEYLNFQLLELPNKDFATTITRQFFIDAFELSYFEALQKSTDKHLAAIAEKTLKEIKYHYRYSNEWMKRLGDGTDISHDKMQTAVDELWMYTKELFEVTDYEKVMIEANLAPDPSSFQSIWHKRVEMVLTEATLQIPDQKYFHTGGKNGKHTEHMGFLLTELQYMQRAFPNMKW